MTGKKCVITGGAGFIGSYLAEKLLSTGFNVHIVDNLSTGKLTNIAHLKDNPNLTFHRFDVRHKNKMLEVADGADWVFHLAAMVGVKQVLDQPFETIQNNVNATENVINATLKTGSALFLASSSEVYGDNPNPVCSEANGLQVGSPYSLRWAYSAGKVFDEFLAASARRHDQRIIIGRFFNIIGRKQNARYGMVVPRFLQQAMKHQPLTVYGDGYQSRSFCDVRDAVSAVAKLCFANTGYHYIFNIGNDSEIAILELARKIKKITMSKSQIIHVPHEMIHKDFEDIKRRKPDLTLIKSLTEWKPKYNLDDSLNEIISCKVENRLEYA